MLNKIEALTMKNIILVQRDYDVDEITSIFMAEGLTAIELGLE